MRLLRPALAAALALAAGCLPSFEDVECYSDFDCPQDLRCEANVCAVAARDAGPRDAGFEDAGGAPDGGDVAPDAGPPDSGAPDAGFEDAGEVDSGAPDAGSVDSGAPDAGPPDAGFDIRFVPTSADFGAVRMGCPVPNRQVSLQNFGPTQVEIEGLGPAAGTSGEFQLTGPMAPFLLAPAATRDVTIAYAPNDVGVDTGAVEATWGGGLSATAALRAEGVLTSQRSDMFTQSGGPIDILFVVDDTMDMAAFQDQLADDLTFLFLQLAFQGWDYQIGVTTTDTSAMGPAGALVGTPPFVTAQTANVEQVVAARIRAGQAGFHADEGMEAARLALSAPLATTGVNAGFLRPNAALLLYFLSNRDDASPMNVSAYANVFEGLKADPARVAVNVVASTASFCSIPNGSATFAGRYIGLPVITDGLVHHICDSTYQPPMEAMPPAPRNRAFALTAQADPMSIAVEVDGAAVPANGGANWTYDATANEVVFSMSAAPPLGAPVRVDYTIDCP